LDLYEGYRWRDKRRMQELAQLASWTTAPHVKRPIDPSKLLKEDKPKKKTTPEETGKMINQLEKLVGVI
jgi:hypothetical protein